MSLMLSQGVSGILKIMTHVWRTIMKAPAAQIRAAGRRASGAQSGGSGPTKLPRFARV